MTSSQKVALASWRKIVRLINARSRSFYIDSLVSVSAPVTSLRLTASLDADGLNRTPQGME
jgi:hypothetical protein